MKEVLQICFCLLLLISIVLSNDAQNKATKLNEWDFTDKDYAKIINPLFQFFYFVETEDSDLKEVNLHLVNVSQEFKKQFVSKIKRKNRNAKIKFLSKKQIENLIQKERIYSEISVIKRTRNSLTLSVADYSPCYATGKRYIFTKKGKWRFRLQGGFVSECGFGCKDGVCLPDPAEKLLQIKKNENSEIDDPPPPLKIKKPNE